MKSVQASLAVALSVFSFLICPMENAAAQVAIQSEDYARARAAFRTKLLLKGPAPQKFTPANVPADVKIVRYAVGDLELSAWIGLPKNRQPKMPAVLFVHGGFAFDGSDFAMAKPFLDAGFVVMTPILRGENGQPGAFTLFFDEVNDVLAASDVLRKLDYVDNSRIFICGHSSGGTLALLAGMATPAFKGIASFGGSLDQAALVDGWEKQKLVPFDQSNPKEFELRSPLAYATSLKSPTRLYVGSQDFFHLAASRKLAEVAQAKKLDVETLTVSGNHYTSVPEAITKSIVFFKSLK
jgi:dipeptidyl aminopeptidase/acylaminoacyl peptidase